jgi:hypothetical protein
MVGGSSAKDKMIAAYALRCTNEADLATFKQYLEEYTTELMEAVVYDLLEYLGIEEGVEVEVVHLTKEQQRKLEASGKLEEYLMDKDKEDYDS